MAQSPAVSPGLVAGAVIVALVLLIAAPLSTIDYDRNFGATFVPPLPSLLGAAFGAFIIPVAGLLLGWKRYSKRTGFITFIFMGGLFAGLSILGFVLNVVR